MRVACMGIGAAVVLLSFFLAFAENRSNAQQGQAPQKGGGIQKALQVAPIQAEEKLVSAMQKGKGKQKAMQQQGGKSKGNGKS